jgi:hypothetical protein
MAPLPVDPRGDGVADRRQRWTFGDGVPDVIAALLRPADAPGRALAQDLAGIGGLASATGIEDGPIEKDGARIGVDLDDGRPRYAGVCIGVSGVFAHADRLARRVADEVCPSQDD